MNKRGLKKLYLGFIFIMFSFRIQGFDLLPDIVGYLFFASGFNDLVSNSTYFSRASKYNIPMIILSVFSIYQSPVQVEGNQLGPLGIFSILIGIGYFVLNLFVVYNLFMGVKEMAEKADQPSLAQASVKKWNHYLLLQIAISASFIMILIPFLILAYISVFFIITIILTITTVGFLKLCSESLA